MHRLQKGILLGGVVGLVALVIVLAATPGSLVTERTAAGHLTNREAVGGLIALLVLGCAALGVDLRDWL